MRGFMRAIGLGGLLKSSPRNSGKAQTSSFHRRNGPAMTGLVPVEDIQLMMPDASAHFERSWSNASRKSSIEERPQFLFFCGSDNSGVPAARRTGYNNATATSPGKNDFSFENAEVQARASIKSPTRIQAPIISHRMPVFFAPQTVAMNGFE